MRTDFCCFTMLAAAFGLLLPALPAGAALRVQSQLDEHEDLVIFEDNGDITLLRGFLAEEGTPEELANDPMEGELVFENQDGIPVARVDHETGIFYIQGHAYPEQSTISESLGASFEVQLTDSTIVAAVTADGDLYCLGEIDFPAQSYTLTIQEIGAGSTHVVVNGETKNGNKIGDERSFTLQYGDRVNLHAEPGSGSYFSEFRDGDGDTAVVNPHVFRLARDYYWKSEFKETILDWPDSMVAFGDSSTLAVLSSNLPWGETDEGGCIPDFSPPPLDCLQQRIINGQPKHSWSTGDAPFDRVNRLYERILAQNPEIRGKNYNMAVSGASLFYGTGGIAHGEPDVYNNSLRHQMENFHNEHEEVDYATIWMGGMDVCGLRLTATQYKTHMKEALIYFRTLYENAIIVVVQLPDIVSIYDEFHDYPGCSWRWTNFYISYWCPNVLGDDDQDRQAAESLNLAFNNAITDAVDELDDGKIFVVPVDFETDVIEGRSDVSFVDCFHPTVRAQQRLAEKAWDPVRFAEED